MREIIISAASLFVIIPGWFAEDRQGVKRHENQFNYAVTNDGDTVVDANAITEFPNSFNNLKATGWQPDTVELFPGDFPQDTITIE